MEQILRDLSSHNSTCCVNSHKSKRPGCPSMSLDAVVSRCIVSRDYDGVSFLQVSTVIEQVGLCR